jgi:carbon storage regulator
VSSPRQRLFGIAPRAQDHEIIRVGHDSRAEALIQFEPLPTQHEPAHIKIRQQGILTRRVGEKLMIGDQVILTVLSLHGRQVRVGIAEPKTVTIYRQEVFERIQREGDTVAPADAPAGDESEFADRPTRQPASPSRSPAHRAERPRASRIGILDPPSRARLFRTPDAATADSAVTVGQTCLVTLSQSIKTSRAQPVASI